MPAKTTHCKIEGCFLPKYKTKNHTTSYCQNHNVRIKQEYFDNQTAEWKRLYKLKIQCTRVGISVDYYESLPKICSNNECKVNLVNNLAKDHGHKTGKFRGLLCRRCNLLLGVLEKNSERIKGLYTYLNDHS